jgi:hypothetical protein
MSVARGFVLPNGRAVRPAVYVSAWRTLKGLPPGELVKGFGYDPERADHVLREMRYGLHDRINRHLPGFGVGRKWHHNWQRAALQCASRVNTPRLVVRWVPADLKARLSHRLYQED